MIFLVPLAQMIPESIPLENLTAPAVGVIVLMSILLLFLIKVVGFQQDTIRRLISKLDRRKDDGPG